MSFFIKDLENIILNYSNSKYDEDKKEYQNKCDVCEKYMSEKTYRVKGMHCNHPFIISAKELKEMIDENYLVDIDPEDEGEEYCKDYKKILKSRKLYDAFKFMLNLPDEDIYKYEYVEKVVKKVLGKEMGELEEVNDDIFKIVFEDWCDGEENKKMDVCKSCRKNIWKKY